MSLYPAPSRGWSARFRADEGVLGAASGSKSAENTSSAASEPKGHTLARTAARLGEARSMVPVHSEAPKTPAGLCSSQHEAQRKPSSACCHLLFPFGLDEWGGGKTGVEARTEEETGSQCFLLPSLSPLCGLKRMFL